MVLSVSEATPVIAVLDDEPQMRKALGRLLRLHGYEVALFENGQSLIGALAQGSLDCILLDLHMPGLNGFGVLHFLAGQPSRPPVIVITGHDEPGNAARATELGASDYLLKPVDEIPLLEAITRSLTERAANDRRPS